MSSTSASPTTHPLPPSPPIPADVTVDEIKTFKSQLPSSLQEDSRWLLILTSAFVSCHHGPETIVNLYSLAFSSWPHPPSADTHKSLQRTIQECLTKGSVIFGIPHALDTVFTLLTHLRSTSSPLLDSSDSPRSSLLSQPLSSLTQPAHEALRRVYRHNLDPIIDEKMGENMEDLKFLTLELNYGWNLACEKVLDWKQTELVLLAALVGQNCRAEVLWHMRGALRAGWSREEVAGVREVAMAIAGRLGVRTDKVPPLSDVKEDSND